MDFKKVNYLFAFYSFFLVETFPNNYTGRHGTENIFSCGLIIGFNLHFSITTRYNLNLVDNKGPFGNATKNGITHKNHNLHLCPLQHFGTLELWTACLAWLLQSHYILSLLVKSHILKLGIMNK